MQIDSIGRSMLRAHDEEEARRLNERAPLRAGMDPAVTRLKHLLQDLTV